MTREDNLDRLYGWDDGKVYFSEAGSGKERCVSDEPELMATIVQACREYYRGREERADG